MRQRRRGWDGKGGDETMPVTSAATSTGPSPSSSNLAVAMRHLYTQRKTNRPFRQHGLPPGFRSPRHHHRRSKALPAPRLVWLFFVQDTRRSGGEAVVSYHGAGGGVSEGHGE